MGLKLNRKVIKSKAEYDAKLRKQAATTKAEELTEEASDALDWNTVNSPIPDLPLRRVQASSGNKTKSKHSSKQLRIPIGIGAGVILLLAVLMFIPRASQKTGPAAISIPR